MSGKLGFNATWSMAVGGMVGGGIFSTLGVVMAIAGRWAWLSFVVAGLIALAAGYAYVRLAARDREGGGAFSYFRAAGAGDFAGALAWVLIAGYVFTNAVYAFTFGQYLGHVVGLGPWFPRAAAVAIVVLFIGLNLRGVSAAGGVEIVLVWFKLAVLVVLAAIGLARWQPSQLGAGVPDAGLLAGLFGAAAVFMAYEGFQLLAYDYDDIANPGRVLPRAVLSAIATVIVVYVVVTVGTAMLIGAGQVVEHQEVALAIAGRQAAGVAGLLAVTVAAAFSTGSAINSTLFATARLAHTVARAGELPGAVDHRNGHDVPDRAVIGLGLAAAALAAVGSLGLLVEAASLAFLFTFAAVSGLAWWQREGHRAVTGFGAVAGLAATLALLIRLVERDPAALAALAGLVVVAIFRHPLVLDRLRSGHS